MNDYTNAAPSSGAIVWLALRMIAMDKCEVLGVFATEAEAVAVCEQWEDVVGPIPFGQKLPDVDWGGSYYPLAKAA